jgi:macrolide transport system ATP-binding/permease protein
VRFLRRLRRTLFGDDRAAEIRDELEFHLAMDVEEGRDRLEARRRLGNPDRIEDETRSIRIIPWLSSILRDLRDAFRLIRNAPVLSLAIVGSLALGIGSNTAIFNLIDAAILKPLPVEDPESLVLIEWRSEGFPAGVESLEGGFGQPSEGLMSGTSVAESFYRQLTSAETGLDAIIAMDEPGVGNMTIAAGDRPAETATLQYVSANFFRELGVIPPLGRGFLEEEDRPGAAPAVVVSYRFWMSQLGGDPNVLDREIRLDNVPARVVGVAPPGFYGFQPGMWTDVYAPLAARAAVEPDDPDFRRDDSYWWVSIAGRLGNSIPEDTVRNRLQAELDGFSGVLAPGSETAPPEIAIASAYRGFDGTLQPNEVRALWILQLLVGVLLLIVCANVANLLLSRSVSVQRDSALRLALGASRGRLFQKSLIESASFAMLGAVIGLGIGNVLARAIHGLFQTGRYASLRFDLGIDWRTIAWVVGLALLTTVLFGMAPAVRAMRAGVSDVLKARSRSVFGGGLRLPRFLVSAQIALCLAALTSAGLLARSLENFGGLDLGIDTERLSYATVNPAAAGYSRERIGPYLDSVRNELRALPGVDHVSIMNRRVLDGAANVTLINLPDEPRDLTNPFDPANAAHSVGVGEGAFETLGISLLRGRGLNAQDTDNVVVDERFVEHFFGGRPAIGRRITLGQSLEFTVVGVTRNVPWGRLREADFPVVYVPAGTRQAGFGGRIQFAIHSSVNPASLAGPVRAAIASVDPAIAMAEFRTQATLINRLLRVERLLAFVSGSFGAWALILAAMGLAGLLTYAAARRTAEIGVRMALGATPARVVSMMLRDSLSMVIIGIVIGLPCAYAIGRVLESMLFELRSTDIPSFVLALIALSLVALAATWLPARRAAAIDPMDALREQ